jgi:hypothetical protein
VSDDRPSGWLWAKLAGAFLGLVAAFVLFVPVTAFEAELVEGSPGCASGWSNLLGMEFCGSFPAWIAIVASLGGIAVGWGAVALVQRLAGRRR